MNLHLNRVISAIALLSVFGTTFPVSPVQAGDSPLATSMDNALLFMITANARLLDDTSGFTDETFAFQNARTAQPAARTSRDQINEQRLLAQYYLNFAGNLPADSPQAKTMLSKAYAHNEMADILQRRRNRDNNPLQQIGRAVTRPFKFVAREVVKLVRQGIQLLDEVGPAIIQEMVKNYLTTGSPINIKVFFKKFKDIALERLRNTVINGTAARLTGVTAAPLAQSPGPTRPSTKTQQAVTETETPAKPEGPKEYGTHTINLGLEDLDVGVMVASEYFEPLIPRLTECAYSDFQIWEFEKISLPLKIDLDKGTFTLEFSGSGTDYMEKNDITIPAWDFEADFTGTLTDGVITPMEDLSGWILEGTMQIKVDPRGETRCTLYPEGYPYVEAEDVWLSPDRSLTFEHDFYGEIAQQKGVNEQGKPVITPGGKITFDFGMEEAEADEGNYLFVQVVDAEIPPAFPVP